VEVIQVVCGVLNALVTAVDDVVFGVLQVLELVYV
jgi:hypothetical protein